MSQYQLIAFDMDGTLLNSNKQISPETLTPLNGQPMQEKLLSCVPAATWLN